MASNIALKRAAKANRRKAVVAEKRKLELLNTSQSAQVLRAAQALIQHCLLCGELFESGMATLFLARGVTSYNLTLAGFLIDAWCLGVKDTFFHAFDAESFECLLADMEAAGPVTSVDPAYARKLLRDAAVWAGSLGIAPHRDFAVIEKFFGDANADTCDATFQFGRNGEPVYIPGRSESPALIGRRVRAIGNILEKLERAEA